MREPDLTSAGSDQVAYLPDAAAQATPAPLPDTSDADLITRAAVAEGDPNDPVSWQNVAGVIRNRMRKSGKTAAQVLSEPGQFESFSNGRLQGVDPASAAYGAASKAIEPVLGGKIAVPYDSFYNPKIVAERGVKPPFDPTAGAVVGTQLFGNAYSPSPEPNLADAAGAQPPAGAPAPQPAPDKGAGVVPYTTGPGTLNDANSKAWEALERGGAIDPKAPPGSIKLPFVVRSGSDKSAAPGAIPAGAYYIQEGQLKRAPGGAAVDGGVAPGFYQGVGDVAQSFGKFLPGAGDSEILAHQEAGRMQYDAQHQGDIGAQIGRFGGQLAASLPLMAVTGAAGGAALKAIPAIAPATEFLTSPGGNFFMKGASLATRGALQGGEGAALTSAASKEPLLKQIEQGGASGAVLGPTLPLLGKFAGAGINAVTGASEKLSDNIAGLADTAIHKYGIPITKAQVLAANGNRNLGTQWSNQLSEHGSGLSANLGEQRDAWTKAVGDTFGGDAHANPVTGFGPATLNGAKKRIGNVLNAVTQGVSATNTNALAADLAQIEQDALQTPMGESGQGAIVKQIDNIRGAIQSGSLSGDDYQALIRHNGPLDLAMHNRDPAIQHAASRIRDALDTTISAALPPDQLKAFQVARAQYKNLQTVARATKTADANDQLTPKALDTAVNQSFKGRAFTGATNSAGDLGELADISSHLMREPPNSGTSPRLVDTLKRSFLPFAAAEGGALGLLHDPSLALKFGLGAGAGAGLKLAGNKMFGLRYGPEAARRMFTVAPVTGPGVSTPALSRWGLISNDNLVPAAAIGVNSAANRMQRPAH